MAFLCPYIFVTRLIARRRHTTDSTNYVRDAGLNELNFCYGIGTGMPLLP